MAELPRLRVGLTLDSATFVSETRRVGSAVDRLGKDVNRQTSSLTRGFDLAARSAKAFGAALGIAIGTQAIGQLGRLAKDALDAAGNLGELSQSAGITVRQLQALTVAGVQVGISQEQLVTSMGQFGRRVGEAAEGTGELAELMVQYGIAARDSEGNVRSSVNVLADFANAVKGAASEQERLRIVSDAFGSRIGSRLLPLLVGGAEGFDVWAKKAQAAGLILSDDLVAKADKASDSIATLQFAVAKGFEIGVVREFADAVEITADNLNSAREAGEFFGSVVGQAMALASQGLASLQPFFATTAKEFRALGALIQGIFELTGTPFAFAEEAEGIEETAQAFGLLEDSAAGVPVVLKKTTDEMERLAEKRVETVAALRLEAEGAKALAQAQKEGAKAVRETEAIIEAETIARSLKIKLLTREGQEILELVRSTKEYNAEQQRTKDIDEAIARATKTLADAQSAQRKRQAAEQKRLAEQAEKLALEPYKNALASIQSLTTETFETIYSGGIKTFGDLADGIKQIFIRLAAEISSLLVFRAATVSTAGLFGGPAAALAAGGAAGGAAAPALATQLGAAGGIAGFRQGLIGGPAAIQPGIAGFREQLIGGPAAIAPAGLLGSTGFLGSNITGGQALLAGGLGAVGGGLIGTQFGGKGQIGGTVGGGLGSAGGALVGSLLGPGGAIAGGLAGGLLGGLGGGFLGGLFGGEEENTGKLKFKSTGGLGGPFGGISITGEESFAGPLTSLIKQFDEGVSQFLTARQEARITKTLKDLETYSERLPEADPSKGFKQILRQRAKVVLREAGLSTGIIKGAGVEEIGQRVGTALQTQAAVKELLAANDASAQFAKRIADIREQFATLTRTAEQYGISTKGLAQAQREAILAVKAQEKAQRAQVQRAVTEAVGGNTLALTIADIKARFVELARSAKEWGISTAGLAGAQREAIIAAKAQERAQRAQVQLAVSQAIGGNTLDVQLTQIKARFAELTALAKEWGISTKGLAQAQREAILAAKAQAREQINILALSVIAPFEQLLAPLEAFQQQLKFADLNPAQQLAAAQADFQRIANLARAGSTIAIDQLASAGELFIRLSEQVGASPGGAAAREEVSSVIESVIEDINKAQQEASKGIEDVIKRASKDQVDTLKELKAEVVKVAEEIKKLNR